MTNEIFPSEGGEQYEGEEFDPGTEKIISELKSAHFSNEDILNALVIITDGVRIGRDDLRKDERGRTRRITDDPREIEEKLQDLSARDKELIDSTELEIEPPPDQELAQDLFIGTTIATLREMGIPDNQFSVENVVKHNQQRENLKQDHKETLYDLSKSDLSQEEVLTGLDIILGELEKSEMALIREKGINRVMVEEERRKIEPIGDMIRRGLEREDSEFRSKAIDKIVFAMMSLGVINDMFRPEMMKWVLEKWKEGKEEMAPSEEIERARKELGAEIAADAKAEAEEEFFEDADKYFKRKGQDKSRQ